MRKTWMVRTALLALLFGAIGCGAADYEEKMRSAQSRAQEFDRENKLLDGPLEVPTEMNKEKTAQEPVAQFFLRPPRGIRIKPDEKPVGPGIYRYSAAEKGGPFEALDIAFGKGNEDLGPKVSRWFRVPVPPFKKPEDGANTFHTAELEYEPNKTASIYVTPLQKDKEQVALVFYTDRTKKDIAGPAIDLSMKTLAIGPDTVGRRRDMVLRAPWAAPHRPFVFPGKEE